MIHKSMRRDCLAVQLPVRAREGNPVWVEAEDASGDAQFELREEGGNQMCVDLIVQFCRAEWLVWGF